MTVIKKIHLKWLWSQGLLHNIKYQLRVWIVGPNFPAVIRQGIKEYGNWPTIPQLYVNKELVGGSDIMMEMFESGELKEMLTK